MCDNKNELQKSERDKSKRNTSTRLDLDITNTTDTYPEFDFLDLLRNLQVENRKTKKKISNEEGNQSNSYSDDSDVELLARFYNEKYGNYSEFDADGYDEDDPFIDNSDAVIESIPNGIQTEFGGFYINRGKLTFIREENSSSSVSEDVDKFLTQKRLIIKRTGLDEDSDEKQKECSKTPGSNTLSSNHVNNKSNNNTISNSNNNNNDNIHIHSSTNNVNSCVNNVTSNNSNNNNGSFGNGTVKSRKKSGEFHHKSKKNRKTATPKIPDHLLHRKPFSGSSEFRKNINEIKKNRMKTLEAEKKPASCDLVSSDSPSASTNIAIDTTTSIAITTAANTTTTTITAVSKNSNNFNNNSNINNKNNNNEIDGNNVNNDYHHHHHNHFLNVKKEACLKKKATTVKEIVKDRDAASEVIEAVATGADLCSKNIDGESSSDSETSESSNSDSGSESSDEKFTEKRKISPRPAGEGLDSQRNASPNGIIKEDITAKNFAHLNDSLKSLIYKIVEISKEEKTKLSNSKLNGLLLRIDSRLRELPVSERSAVLDHLATILQLKRESITKKTKKLLFIQEETKMTVPLGKLKETVADMMPALESNYLKDFTKATGTSTVDPGPLPVRRFPWNEDLRCNLREIIKHRENCYHIVRPRKESLSDYVRNFLETKLISFWPKDWMTVDILWEEGKSTPALSGSPEDKAKTVNKVYQTTNSSTSSQKKSFGNFQNVAAGNKKPVIAPVPSTESAKSSPNFNKSAEVKSILIPRKVPQNVGNTPTKPSYSVSTSSVLQSNSNVARFQGTGNKLTTQEYLEKLPQNRNCGQPLPNNKPQQQLQSQQTRVIKSVSGSGVQNTVRPNVPRTTSPNPSNKSVLNRNCSNSQQNMYKTIEIHSKPVAGSKSVGNAVTISPVTESMLKDFSSSPEILNLTKNPSVCISKITDCSDSKYNRSSSPSVNKPLPSGITISPTNATSSNFLSKPKKPLERTSENRINVSITKQNPSKDKKKSVLNMNVKREGPLHNIPDCISVTSNIVSHERLNKVEHVRKRAIQEYHEQQQQQIHSPERLKLEEKKIKLEENFAADVDIREEKLEDKNFSKILESVITKTSESVNHGVDSDCQITGERYPGLDGDSITNSNNLPVFSGLSHYKSKPPKLREVRVGKEKPYLIVKGDGSSVQGSDEKRSDECEDYSEKVKELQVQKEMDRVMQNLVELSSQRVKDSDYEIESHYSPSAPPPKPQSSFQVYPKMLYK